MAEEDDAAVVGNDDKKASSSSSTLTTTIIINTDWRMEEAGQKVYGMCFVRVSPPYEYMNFKRGFSLPNPTPLRCALFSLLLGLEMLDSIPTTTSTRRPCYVVSTKHKWLFDTINGGNLNKWCSSSSGRKWPKNVAPMKGLFIRLHDDIVAIASDEKTADTTIVYIERDRENGDTGIVDLISKKDDLDVEKILAKEKGGGGREAIDKALRDMRMRNTMIEELMASGARGSRFHKKRPDQKDADDSSFSKKKQSQSSGKEEDPAWNASTLSSEDGRRGTAIGGEVRAAESAGKDAPVPQPPAL
jgi:hypothetical protein